MFDGRISTAILANSVSRLDKNYDNLPEYWYAQWRGVVLHELIKRSDENDGELTSLIKYPSILLDSPITGASIGARIEATVGCFGGQTGITIGAFLGAVVGAAADVANPFPIEKMGKLVNWIKKK